jgi:hypothetical protein
MADEPSQLPRFQRRTKPYIPGKDDPLIAAAHRRRHDKFTNDLEKLDQRHPGAFGLTMIRPEIGFNRFSFSGLLRGFERTKEFQQFIAHMCSYAKKTGRDGRYRFNSEERYATGSASISDVISRHKNGSNTRDALRTFFTNLAQLDGYQPSWKASHLTMDLMKAELAVVAELPEMGSDQIARVLIGIKSKIKDTADLLYLAQLIDAIARQRDEPLPPTYPFEEDTQSTADAPIRSAFPILENASNSNQIQSSTDVGNVEEGPVATDILANMPVEIQQDIDTAARYEPEHWQMQMMELPANIDLGNVEEGPVATSILANMPVEIQVPQTTDTIMKQQDLLLLQIMSTWPEDEDADKWDDRMDAFLAEICSIEEDLTYPLLEWKHTFERLKPQARISLEVMEQQAPVQLRSLPRETKATDTIKNKKNKKKKIKKEPIKQSRAAPPSKSKEPAKAITRKSSRAAEPIYEVDRILGVKRNRKGDVLGYKVSWKGYDASHNSIVSAADAVGCDRLIREYLARTS